MKRKLKQGNVVYVYCITMASLQPSLYARTYNTFICNSYDVTNSTRMQNVYKWIILICIDAFFPNIQKLVIFSCFFFCKFQGGNIKFYWEWKPSFSAVPLLFGALNGYDNDIEIVQIAWCPITRKYMHK